MTAAKTSDYADSAVGNVNGSNAVNVFLGQGLPWVIAAMYHAPNNYLSPSPGLAYSVIVFLCCSVTCFVVLFLRRTFIGGELGGPKTTAYASTAFLIGLWLLYVVLSILKSSEG